MNKGTTAQLTSKLESRSQIQHNHHIWLRLLPPENSEVAQELAKVSDVLEFQIGDIIHDSRTSILNDQTVSNEQNVSSDTNLYMVCQGRVRLIEHQTNQSRSQSLQVVDDGGTFGADPIFCSTALPYQAIAASPVQIVRVAIAQVLPWLEQVPKLREHLQQQAMLRERLIFFKSFTSLKTLTSQAIQNLLPYLVEISVSAGEPITQLQACNSGHFWIRAGEIDSLESGFPAPAMGGNWGYPAATPNAWVAKTDLRLYRLSSEYWHIATAIAPNVFASPPTSTAANGKGTTTLDPTTDPTTPAQGLQTYRQSLISASRSAIAAPPTPPRDHSPVPNARRADRPETPPPPVSFPQPKRQRRLRLWQGYPFIQQQSSSDCGVACLAMIAQYWGKRLSINMLRNLADVGRSGASLKNLATTAESVGFHARPVRASLSRLVEQKKPWVAHWEGDHYVVVYWVKGDRVLVADPARGNVPCPVRNFSAIGQGMRYC